MFSLKHRLLKFVPAPLRCALRSWNSVRQVRQFSADRWEDAGLVQKLIRPGDVVVDAGANIGYITALLARWVGTTGLVHAIEPIPETFQLLQRSMRELKLDQVRLHACGVSDSTGQAVMEVPTYPDGAENFYESHLRTASDASHQNRSFSVDLRTLDELVGDTRSRVAFIKMDVEGHEEPALRGASRLLAEARPALLVEIDDRLDQPSPPTARLMEQLSALGYGVYVSERGVIRPLRAGEKRVDYFFLTPEHLSSRLNVVVS